MKRTQDLANIITVSGDQLRIKRTKVTASTTDPVDLEFPWTSGMLATTGDIETSTAAFVDLETPQTILADKTFDADIQVTGTTTTEEFQIRNTAIVAPTADVVELTLPSDAGTLALTSDISTATSDLAADIATDISTATSDLAADIATDIAGLVTLGTPQTLTANKTFNADLVVNGTVFSDYFASTNNGTAAAPAYGISGGTGLGMFSGGANQLNWATGGTSRLQLLSSSLTSAPRIIVSAAGTNAAVSYGCGSANEGTYFNSTSNGLALASGTTATDVLYAVGTRTVQTIPPGVSLRVAGTNSNPSLRMQDTNAGWYSAGSNIWGYAVPGPTTIMTIGPTGMSLGTNPINSCYLNADNCTLFDASDTTKRAIFSLSSITTGTTRTLTLPNGTGALVLNSGTTILTGLKTFTAGIKLGTNGTTLLNVLEGSVATGTVIGAAGTGILATIDVTAGGFASVPHCFFSIRTPSSGGTQSWDRVFCTVGAASATSIEVIGCNMSSTVATSGTATLFYRFSL
jgi:hypothetical protein